MDGSGLRIKHSFWKELITYGITNPMKKSLVGHMRTMHHRLLLLGILLLPEAYTLKCYECAAGSSATCIDTTKECPPMATHCSALRIIMHSGESVIADINGKSCSFSEQCAQASVNFGKTRTVLTNECCTIDSCNSLPAPDYSKTRPSGRKCFTCNGLQCTSTVECQGNEYHCISTTVEIKGQSTTMKGCASKQMCTNTEQLERLAGTRISCCEGDYCNGGSRPRASLLLLGAPLLYLIVWP